jgi:type VI secretion system protein ImpG
MHELFPYYEQELAYMRGLASEFAKLHPDAASRLDLERYRCEDPHVERLIEAFCLIAARLHQRLDFELPELTQAFLSVLHPQYFRPVPSMSIAQFASRPDQGVQPECVTIDRDRPVKAGDVCTFRTCYPVDLWPFAVNDASLSDASGMPGWAAQTTASGTLRLTLQGRLSFSQLSGFDRLKFYLNGQGSVPFDLYELLVNHTSMIVLRDPEREQTLLEIDSESLRPIGFEKTEGIIPYHEQSFLGFRLLQEYFAFPEKFLFLELSGLQKAVCKNPGEKLEIVFLLDDLRFTGDRFRRLQFAIGPENFLLGCTPIVNLFSTAAEPVRLDRTKPEYSIIPDLYRPQAHEVYSIDSVTSRSFGAKETRHYKPLYSFEHGSVKSAGETFWYACRRPSHIVGDRGTEVYLTLVDLGAEFHHPEDETLLIELTCTNRDLPSDLVFRYVFGELEANDARVSARCVRRPSAAVRAPVQRRSDWRFVSHLSLNYLTLISQPADASGDSQNGAALRELLELYNFSEDPGIRRQVQGLAGVSSSPARARIRMKRGNETVPVFCHGTAVSLDFNGDVYASSGLFLFAAVLERFLALYAPVNSFTQVTAATGGGRVIKKWAPRCGEQVLI